MGNTVTSLSGVGEGARARNLPKLLKALRRAKDERGVQFVARTLARNPRYLLRREPKYSALSTTVWHEAASNPRVGGELIDVLEAALRAWVPTFTAKQIKKLDAKLKVLRGKKPAPTGAGTTSAASPGAFQRASAPTSVATSPLAATTAPATSLTAEAEAQDAAEEEARDGGAVAVNGANGAADHPRQRSRSTTGVARPPLGGAGAGVGAGGAETGTDVAEDDDDDDDEEGEEDEDDDDDDGDEEDEEEEAALLGNDAGTAAARDQTRSAAATANGGAAAAGHANGGPVATAAAATPATATPATTSAGAAAAAAAVPLSSAHEALVAKVLEAAMDGRNQLGQTPLMVASSEGAVGAVKALLKMGSDPLAIDNRGSRTALHLAARDGKAEALELLLLAAAERYPLIRATDVGTVTSLTPLHYASYGGWVDVAEVLLRHGAALMPVSTGTQYDTSPDDPGTTPLHVCAWRGDVVMCRQLLAAHLERSLMRDPRRAHTDPRSARTCHGHSPMLMLHRRECDRPIAKLLNPSLDLVALMPDVVAAAAAAAMRAGGAAGLSCVVPPLQFLAAAVLSSQMLVSISKATTAAARAAGKAGGSSAAAADGAGGANGSGAAAAPKATTADAAMSSIFNPDASSSPSSGPSVTADGAAAGGAAAGLAVISESPAAAAAAAPAAAAAAAAVAAAAKEAAAKKAKPAPQSRAALAAAAAAEARVRAAEKREEEEAAAALAVLAAAEAAAAAAAAEVADVRGSNPAGDAIRDDVSVASTAASAATAATAATAAAAGPAATGAAAATRAGGAAAGIDPNAAADTVQVHVVAHSTTGVTLSSVPAGADPRGPQLFGRMSSSVAGSSPLAGASPILGSSPRASGTFAVLEARVSGAGNGELAHMSGAPGEGSLLPPPALGASSVGLGAPSVGIGMGSVSIGLAPVAGGAGAVLGAGGGNTCSVCMDAAVMVRSSGCGHPLCAGCAQKLAAQVLRRVRPLACPFCRQVVPNFEAIAVKKQ